MIRISDKETDTTVGRFRVSESFIAIKLKWTIAVIFIPNSGISVLQSAVNNFLRLRNLYYKAREKCARKVRSKALKRGSLKCNYAPLNRHQLE